MHYFKLLGNPDSFKDLWENRESLDKYLERLKELMEEDERIASSLNDSTNEQTEDQSSKHSF